MKYIVLTILICVFITDANASNKQYERLSHKLIEAEKVMYKVYKGNGKKLNTHEKSIYRVKQYTWKKNKEKECTQKGMVERSQTECKYRKIVKRIKYLRSYISLQQQVKDEALQKDASVDKKTDLTDKKS